MAEDRGLFGSVTGRTESSIKDQKSKKQEKRNSGSTRVNRRNKPIEVPKWIQFNFYLTNLVVVDTIFYFVFFWSFCGKLFRSYSTKWLSTQKLINICHFVLDWQSRSTACVINNQSLCRPGYPPELHSRRAEQEVVKGASIKLKVVRQPKPSQISPYQIKNSFYFKIVQIY